MSARRLVVELNRVALEDLGDMVQVEESNRTTVVNRALRLYAMFRRVDLAGGEIYVREADSSELQRIRFL